MNNITVRYILLLYIISCTNLLYANSSDLYSNFQYVNNKQVLLYKIMNWWNIENNKNEITPCNKSIKYKKIENIQVKYNSSSKELTFLFKNSFANLVDVLKQYKNCYGSSYLKNIFLNKKYFNNGTTENITKELSEIEKLTFHNISKKEAFEIINIEKDITLVLEGVIGGLLLENNKISLHQAGKFFRTCPKKGKEDFPINFTIIKNSTDEILVRYTAIWNKI